MTLWWNPLILTIQVHGGEESHEVFLRVSEMGVGIAEFETQPCLRRSDTKSLGLCTATVFFSVWLSDLWRGNRMGDSRNEPSRPEKKAVAAKKAKVEKATSKPKSAVEARCM